MTTKCDERIICFDGQCNLCDGFVNFIIFLDRSKVFKFCSLQSEFGYTILTRLKAEKDFSSIIYVESLSQRIYFKKSEAVLQIFSNIGFPYNILAFFGRILVPTTYIRDKVYDYIARNRYIWFGKHDNCRLPTKEEKSRFL